MSLRPGVNIAIIDTPPARTAPTDTGVWFIAGLTEKGAHDAAIPVTSLAEVKRFTGDRVSYGVVYDALDVFFREGGTKAYVGRVVGPAAVRSFVVLNDGSAVATLRVEGKTVGDWGNALNVQVIAGGAGGTFILIVTHDTLGELERSPDLLDKSEAFTWAQNSDWIRLVDQGGSVLDPAVVGPVNLAGGTDDRASIVDSHWTAVLNLFTKDLGPGQVSQHGRTTTIAHTATLAHAAAMGNRTAILDAPNVAVKATLLAALVAARTNGQWGGMFWPHDTVPGITSGTTRTVAPSARVAGQIAKTDSLFGSNTPAAGENGQAAYALGLSLAAFSDLDREELNTNGLNVSIMKFGGVRTYGWRSLANPVTLSNWVNLANSRLLVEIAAQADEVGETFMFDEIDGEGRVTGAFGGALTGMLMPYWARGSLYGAAPNEAFIVDVGPSVNTPTTLANRELRAVIGIRPSPFAEMITIQIVKTQITQPL